MFDTLFLTFWCKILQTSNYLAKKEMQIKLKNELNLA